MDALDVIFTRRSIRQYTDEPVPEEQVKILLEAGMNAPSANNRQPWHFIMVDAREHLKAIMEVHPYSKMLEQAPMAIVVCADVTRSERYWQQDCAAATENILLAARALGLGSVWLGVYPKEERTKGITRLFDLPEHIRPLCVIAVGHPAKEAGRVERYDSSKVHRNQW
jgi:nitroreductase